MKKIVKTLIFVFLFFFGVIIKANAEYVYCYYGYTPDDSDFLITKRNCLFSCDERASLVLQIAYDDTRDDLKKPYIYGTIIEAKDADYSDGYAKETDKDTNRETIDCLITNTTCFSDLPSINLKNIQDNNGKLTCPDVYLYKKVNTNPVNGSKSSTWTISLDPNAESLYGKKFDKKYTVTPDLNYSNKSEDPEPENNTKIVATCNYKYENYVHTAFISGSGTVGFSILEDGTVDEIISTGDTLNGENFVFDGKIDDKKCPLALSFEKKMGWTSSKFYIRTCNSSNCDAYYDGDINSGEDNKFELSYISLKNSENEIKISASENVYKVVLNDQTITIENIDQVTNTTPPKYILYKDGQYTFTDTIDKSGDDLFASSGAYTGLKALTSKEIEATCNALFGGGEGGFMTFLKENVFKIIYIVVPIILLVLTTIDFSKVVFNDDKDGIKNAWKRFGKRAIAAVLIYLTPTILIFIADVIGANDVNSCIKAIRNYSESDN